MKKKRDRNKFINDKIILFPDLEKRLLEKGLDSLQQKKFRDAIDYLEKAMELEPENNDIHIGLVLAYFESGSLQKAKELANNMLQIGIGNYIEIIDIYLMILVQLHQYNEIITTIEILLEEKEVPKEKYEHFSHMLEFSRRMVESTPDIESEQGQMAELTNKELSLFSIQDQKEQMQLAAQLTDCNIHPYIEEICLYLQSKEGHYFFKTMLLNVLKEHGYDKEILINKLDMEKYIIPADLIGLDQIPQMENILLLLGNQLEHEDPILYENIKGLIERHFFVIYPFNLTGFGDGAWAAAYHYLANEYHGIHCTRTKLALVYDVKEEEIILAEDFIRKIEEISYLNI